MRGAIPPLPNTPSWRGAQLRTEATLPLLCIRNKLNTKNIETANI